MCSFRRLRDVIFLATLLHLDGARPSRSRRYHRRPTYRSPTPAPCKCYSTVGAPELRMGGGCKYCAECSSNQCTCKAKYWCDKWTKGIIFGVLGLFVLCCCCKGPLDKLEPGQIHQVVHFHLQVNRRGSQHMNLQ